jgi:hypothetical protein
MKPNLNLVLASFERAHHFQSPVMKRDDGFIQREHLTSKRYAAPWWLQAPMSFESLRRGNSAFHVSEFFFSPDSLQFLCDCFD